MSSSRGGLSDENTSDLEAGQSLGAAGIALVSVLAAAFVGCIVFLICCCCGGEDQKSMLDFQVGDRMSRVCWIIFIR